MTTYTKKKLWIIGAVIVFVAIVAGTLFLLSPMEEKPSTPDKIKISMVNIRCDKDRCLLDNKIDTYCSKCGRHFSEMKFDLSDNWNFIMYECPFCKGHTSTRQKFCSKCGHNMEETNKYVNEHLEYLCKD